MTSTPCHRHEKERTEIAYEAAIWLTGTTTSPLTTMSTTDVTRAGIALSPNRLYIAELRVPTLTGGQTDQAIAVVIGAGSTAAIASTGLTLATFPTLTGTSQQMTQTAVDLATTAAKSAVLRAAFRVSEDRPFVRAQITMSGTSPVAANMSVLVIPAEAIASA